MDKEVSNTIPGIVVKIYFALTAVCIIAELFELKQLLAFFKPLIIPTLIALYLLTSEKKNPLYIISLLFALASNIFLLTLTPEFLMYGHIAIIIYRAIAVFIVLKLTDKFMVLPFTIATMPFLFIFSCLINLTMTSDSPNFYPAIINGLLISALAGIALSSYVMNDNKANSWLAISTLLFIVLAFLFMIQKYYLANLAFQPISAFVFAFAHYAFYRFVIEAEKPTEFV